MDTKADSDWRGCWAILWRSVVFVPYMLAVFICVGGVWLSRWFFPIFAVFLLYLHEWWQGAVAVTLWLLSVRAYRRFHLERFFEPPPSLL